MLQCALAYIKACLIAKTLQARCYSFLPVLHSYIKMFPWLMDFGKGYVLERCVDTALKLHIHVLRC